MDHIFPRGRLGSDGPGGADQGSSDAPAFDARTTALAEVEDVGQSDELDKLGEPRAGSVEMEQPPAA
ncbi:MAG TPA: hypothetical protein VHY81_10410 [Acidimicrobiales bacterium]|nr:hypothetical protein [Acidimicrobiales bacterium]